MYIAGFGSHVVFLQSLYARLHLQHFGKVLPCCNILFASIYAFVVCFGFWVMIVMLLQVVPNNLFPCISIGISRSLSSWERVPLFIQHVNHIFCNQFIHNYLPAVLDQTILAFFLLHVTDVFVWLFDPSSLSYFSEMITFSILQYPRHRTISKQRKRIWSRFKYWKAHSRRKARPGKSRSRMRGLWILSQAIETHGAASAVIPAPRKPTSRGLNRRREEENRGMIFRILLFWKVIETVMKGLVDGTFWSWISSPDLLRGNSQRAGVQQAQQHQQTCRVSSEWATTIC